MKPGDLVRWREEYIDENDRCFYEGKVGLIISLYEDAHPFVQDYAKLFNVLFDGMLIGGFDYEMEVVSPCNGPDDMV